MRDILRRCRFTPYRKGTGLPSFSLTTWDAHKRDHHGKSGIGYELRMHLNGKTTVLFTGENFYNSPMHCTDSDASIKAIMGFLTLCPGDTDEEFFENDTDEVKAYRRNYDESLLSAVEARFGDETALRTGR